MAKPAQDLPSSPLTAISPLDGRYQPETYGLQPFVSEYALIKTRLGVEIQYLLALSQEGIIRNLSEDEQDLLVRIEQTFSVMDAERVKEIERKTKHDVKAVEMFLRELLEKTSLNDTTEMLHFGLTSEDINNISYRLMLKNGMQHVCIPALEEILLSLIKLSEQYKELPMLARTHGQAAVPTTLGKELVVFATRLNREMQLLKTTNLTGKLNGAVGNYNALTLAYPDTDWLAFSSKFTESLGLTPNLTTTQINTYEDVVAYVQILQRINTILIDFNQDMWRYISDGWFVQEVKSEEVGSSTMPQKINPIFFENSEGNLGLADSLIEQFARKLPISRLQRDLSDSTVMRNIGTILGYSLLAYRSTQKGLSRVRPDEDAITNALDSDWAILTEAAQTLLRKEQIPDSYNLVKSLSRGEHITEKQWQSWVAKLPVADKTKQTLSQLTPATYIGQAVRLTEQALEEIRSSGT